VPDAEPQEEALAEGEQEEGEDEHSPLWVDRGATWKGPALCAASAARSPSPHAAGAARAARAAPVQRRAHVVCKCSPSLFSGRGLRGPDRSRSCAAQRVLRARHRLCSTCRHVHLPAAIVTTCRGPWSYRRASRHRGPLPRQPPVARGRLRARGGQTLLSLCSLPCSCCVLVWLVLVARSV
jgi:hypothetical protein